MFIDDLKGFQKETSEKSMSKSVSQPNLVVKQEIKVDTLAACGEEIPVETTTITKKRLKTEPESPRVVKKKKSL